MNIDATIEKIINLLKTVKGIDAIVLGGSRARGNFTSKSDIDIGIYYRDGSLLDLEELSRIATDLDDAHRQNLITKIGEWGPWINGGGWLKIDGIATDFLLRDLNKVSTVIDDCLKGIITIDYQPGHPHGFVNTIYVAETYYCKVLWDNSKLISILKGKINPYPLATKKGIVEKFLWEAAFFTGIADKSLSKNDIVYTTGCIYRVVSCLIQVLYALNEKYIMNEKGALAAADTFEIVPKDFKKKVEKIFCSLTAESKNMKNMIDELTGIVREVEELCIKHI